MVSRGCDGECVCVCDGESDTKGVGVGGCWLQASCKANAEIIGSCFKQIKYFFKEL